MAHHESGAFMPHTNTWKGSRFERFGMKDFIENILNSCRGKVSFDWGGKDGKKMIRNEGETFFSELETDLATVKKRQKILARFFSDRKLTNFLLTKDYPYIAGSRDREDYSDFYAMVRGSVEYLTELQKLLDAYPEYQPFALKLKRLLSKEFWFPQFKKLHESVKGYGSCTIEADLVIRSKSPNVKTIQRYFEIESKSYTASFKRKEKNFPTYNRLTGNFSLHPEVRPKRKKGDPPRDPSQVRDVSFEEATRMIERRAWEHLLKKAIDDFGASHFRNMKEKESTGVKITILIPVSNKRARTAKVTIGEKTRTYIWVNRKREDRPYENYVSDWKGEKEKMSLNKKEPYALLSDGVSALRRDMFLVSSYSFVREYSGDVRQIFKFIHQLLFLAAASEFYSIHKKKWIFPNMLPKGKMITRVANGMNPLFIENKLCVGNDVNFSPAKKLVGLMVTGANTGGKTGFANMIAINQMLAQAGFPIFAESADMSMKDSILCHYVESEDIGVNKSRYQSELHRLREIIEKITRYSLAIFDEPFSGTTVDAGTHQAYEVLRVLAKIECAFIMNTHFGKLVDMVSKNGTSNIQSCHFQLPSENKDAPTDFKLLQGGSYLSQGEAIALSEKVDYQSMMEMLRKRNVFV